MIKEKGEEIRRDIEHKCVHIDKSGKVSQVVGDRS